MLLMVPCRENSVQHQFGEREGELNQPLASGRQNAELFMKVRVVIWLLAPTLEESDTPKTPPVRVNTKSRWMQTKQKKMELMKGKGVLWMGNDAIPGSVDTIKTLKKLGKPVIYVTNNSTKSRVEFLKKLDTLGYPATVDTIVPTAYCAAAYFQSINFKKKVYILGSSGIAAELDKAGIPYLPIGPDPVEDNWIQWIDDVKLDPEVGAVIVGFDHYISYPKLTKAGSYLKDPSNLFIATNRDEQFPTRGNLIIPGAGTFLAAVEAVCGRKAITLGKPEKFMLDCIKMTHPDIDFSRCLMIGDRLNTDILLGTKHGLKTLLVGSGINSLEDVRQFEQSADESDHLFVPDYYLPRLGDLLKFIKA